MSDERVWISSPSEEEETCSCGEDHEEEGRARGGFVALDEKSGTHLELMTDLMEADIGSEPVYMVWAVLAALQHTEIPSA